MPGNVPAFEIAGKPMTMTVNCRRDPRCGGLHHPCLWPARFGRTENPANLSIENRVRHAKAFINALKRDRYHVIGNFVGGYIAARLSIGKNQQAARLRRGAKPPDRCSTNCPRLKTKTLLLCGAQDRGVSVERGILLFQLIPNAVFHLFDQCAHWVQWDQAERFNRLVADFLKS